MNSSKNANVTTSISSDITGEIPAEQRDDLSADTLDGMQTLVQRNLAMCNVSVEILKMHVSDLFKRYVIIFILGISVLISASVVLPLCDSTHRLCGVTPLIFSVFMTAVTWCAIFCTKRLMSVVYLRQRGGQLSRSCFRFLKLLCGIAPANNHTNFTPYLDALIDDIVEFQNEIRQTVNKDS